MPLELSRFDRAAWGGDAHAACRWWAARDAWMDALSPEEREELPIDVRDKPDVPVHSPAPHEPPCDSEHMFDHTGSLCL